VAVRDWQTAGLLKPSVIKPIIATVDARIVHRQLGRLQADDQAALRQVLVDVLG
jgi:mRNA interferase MazF